jgi:hypothetical protein
MPRLIIPFRSFDPRWHPLLGPDEEHEGKAPVEVDSEEDFLGEFIIRSPYKLSWVRTYVHLKEQHVRTLRHFRIL